MPLLTSLRQLWHSSACIHRSSSPTAAGPRALVRPFCLHPVSFASAFIHPAACFSMYLVLSYAQASQCQQVDACSAGKRWWQGSFLVATCTSTSSRLSSKRWWQGSFLSSIPSNCPSSKSWWQGSFLSSSPSNCPSIRPSITTTKEDAQDMFGSNASRSLEQMLR